jgi:hypothetical protein
MSELKEGQRVKVELEGVLSLVDKEGVYVRVPADRSYAHWIWLEHAKVTPLDPPDWPPRVGDIWEAEGREWFARITSETSIFIPEDNNPSVLLAAFKALNPVLVRRRGR